MLQYLVILLDDTSVAYCHADNPLKERRLMSIETLKRGILFGMKQNLMIQYVFPNYELPKEYAEVIESIDNVKIYPAGCKPVTGIEENNETDVVVANSVSELEKYLTRGRLKRSLFFFGYWMEGRQPIHQSGCFFT